ncbi:hypothetical protein EsH8_VI_000430 [Colletotrichum jinshuiense]
MASEPASTTAATETATEHVCLPFSPGPKQAQLLRALKEIPRYLFRVHASNTSGQTSSTEVVSRTALLGRPSAEQDIFAMPSRDAADMLNCHLRGWPRDSDNLMSWTSSLLFALVYALYRSLPDKDGFRNEMSDIRIYVLDTKNMPAGAFMSDMALIDTFVGKDSENVKNLFYMRRLRRDTQYNFGEYLCQGKLSIAEHSTSTTLQDLINHGLFKLCPEMAEPNENSELAKRVCRFRTGCFSSPAQTTRSEVRSALILAQGCFGEVWALPLTAAFLSLRRRARNDIVIINAFHANFSDNELKEHELGTLKTFYHDRHPEVQQFANTVQDIHSDHCARALDSIIATTMSLSISSPSAIGLPTQPSSVNA